jgi:DNA invertase Pin-like site-specific DNA recombinase
MLQVALGLLENGMVLVVDRNDRLARDMLVALTIHHEVESKGCTIEFADGSPLRCTPEGRLFQNILASFAQFEREKFSERTKSGLAKKKRDGVWCGRPPIGYRKVKGKDELEEDVKEQQAIRYIMRNCHHASNCIASDLNKYYLPCRKKPWSARTVRRIIAREKSKVSS